MRVLGPADVGRALPMAEAVDAMRAAFAAHARGEVISPPRSVLRTGDEFGATLVMPAALKSGDPPLLAVKVVSVFPENRRRDLPSIHGTVLAVDSSTGVPMALLDGASMTAIRTAAACGLATDLLSRRGSRVLAVFGSGVHARTQVGAVRAVRTIEEVRIFNPNAASAAAMAEELSETAPLPGGFHVATSPAEALNGADVACAATTSRMPIFEDANVPDGLHINAIGSFKPEDREIPGETVLRARVVVDDRESAMEEAGDLLIPMGQGLFDRSHIHCALGDLVLGRCEGRSTASQVTFFKSVGLSVQDVVAAQAILRRAEALELGARIDW